MRKNQNFTVNFPDDGFTNSIEGLMAFSNNGFNLLVDSKVICYTVVKVYDLDKAVGVIKLLSKGRFVSRLMDSIFIFVFDFSNAVVNGAFLSINYYVDESLVLVVNYYIDFAFGLV